MQIIRIGIILTTIGTFCQDLGITNLNDNPILMIKTGRCKIQTGNTKIVHPINLTDLELTIQTLTNIAYTKVSENNALKDIVKHKIRDVYSNFYQIRPQVNRRTKRWDALGSTWKWIAGNPDAQDLRIINTTLNQLIDENNIQYTVNEQLGQRIQQLTNTINNIAENYHINQIALKELDTITLILNVDVINKILLDIQDAVLLSKTATTNSKILSLKEVNIIKEILQNQGVTVDLPDEALTYITPKIAANKDTLLYILHVPQLQERESDIIRIFSLNNNNSAIKDHPSYIIKHGKEIFTTIKPEDYVQRSFFIQKFEDECIYPLINGKQSHCITRTETHTEVKLIGNNQLLITNAKNDELKSNCGPDNRPLKGNLLISFSNCTITILGRQFTSNEIIEEPQFIHNALHNVLINHQLLENHDIGKIDNRTLLNRSQIQHVYLKQYSNEIWRWSLFGGLSVTTTMLITLIAFLILSYRRSIDHRSSRTHQRKINTSKSSLNPENPCSSAEDDTFSPPGGVMSGVVTQ